MVSSRVDVYQARYLKHRSSKQKAIGDEVFDAMQSRRSQRTFSDEKWNDDELTKVYEAVRLAPSSCNRQAILVKPITEDGEKAELDDLLVGGEGWLGNAQIVLLLFADMLAYKSPAEKDFMPYLDAGFVGQNVYLVAEASGIGACYVNPNIREVNKARFDERFNPRRLLFCGAMALGKYVARAPESPKRELEGIFY